MLPNTVVEVLFAKGIHKALQNDGTLEIRLISHSPSLSRYRFTTLLFTAKKSRLVKEQSCCFPSQEAPLLSLPLTVRTYSLVVAKSAKRGRKNEGYATKLC